MKRTKVAAALIALSTCFGCAAEIDDEVIVDTDEEIVGTATQELEWLKGSWRPHYVIWNQYTSKCIDVPGGQWAPPANQYSCHQGGYQQFVKASAEAGTYGSYTVLYHPYHDKCLTALDQAGKYEVRAYSCDDAEDQHFKIRRRGRRGYQIESRAFPGKCLDVPGGWSANSLALQLYDCHGGANQRWNFTYIGMKKI